VQCLSWHTHRGGGGWVRHYPRAGRGGRGRVGVRKVVVVTGQWGHLKEGDGAMGGPARSSTWATSSREGRRQVPQVRWEMKYYLNVMHNLTFPRWCTTSGRSTSTTTSPSSKADLTVMARVSCNNDTWLEFLKITPCKFFLVTYFLIILFHKIPPLYQNNANVTLGFHFHIRILCVVVYLTLWFIFESIKIHVIQTLSYNCSAHSPQRHFRMYLVERQW
jgi:hypothetical protein